MISVSSTSAARNEGAIVLLIPLRSFFCLIVVMQGVYIGAKGAQGTGAECGCISLPYLLRYDFIITLSTSPQSPNMSSVRATSSHTVKRSASEMDELSSDEEKPDVSSEYEASPSPSPKRKGKRNGKTANGSRSTKKSKTNEPVGEWSPQLRHTLMELIFDRGTEGLNYGELSAKVSSLR